MFNVKTEAFRADEAPSGAGTRLLRPEELDLVTGGRIDDGDKIVIVGCTTRPPSGGYPPGTVVWNPWINPHGPFNGGGF